MLKKIFFWFGVVWLAGMLLAALVTLPTTSHLTNRNSVKSWVSDAMILEGIVETIPTFLSNALDGEETIGLVQVGEQALGIDDQQLVEASKEILTTQYVSEKLFPVIDGVYDWLEGETDSPEFDVVLSDRLTAIVESVSKPLTSELAKLPACPSTIQYSESFNPLDTPCVPQGTDVETIVDEFSRQITGEKAIADISFSSDDIEFDEEVLTAAPQIYSGVGNFPYVFGVMILLLSVGVVFLANSWRKGLAWVSWVFIGAGLVTALSYFILGRTDYFFEFNSEDDGYNIFTEKIAEPFARVVLKDISSTGLKLSLATATLGAGIWLAGHIHHKVAHEQKASAKKSQKKIKDTTPTERQESLYVNKISKK